MNQHGTPVRRAPQATSRITTADIGVGPDFKRTARHTRRVRLLRWLLPAIVVIGAGAYLLSVSIPDIDLPIEFDSVTIDGEGVVIERPQLADYQADGEPYTLSAARAIQRNDNPNQLILEEVVAEYVLDNGARAEFFAPAGEYNSSTTLMALSGGVEMSIGDSVTLSLETVTVDVPNGTISTDRPFRLAAGNLLLTGNDLMMTDSDLTIGGGVHTEIGADGVSVPLPMLGGGQ